MDIKESSMKRVALLALIVASFASAKIITVVDNGVKRKISIDTPSQINARMVGSTTAQKKEIIVAFKKEANRDAFAKKYNLSLKTVLAKKYYIYKNNSNLSDSDLIAKIIQTEKKILTIRPNWGFGFKAR
jgi:predicted RND superfamily exporter protein